MKLYTHPKLNLTFIQTKDGSLYVKRWLVLRSNILLEVDVTSHLLWLKKNNKQLSLNTYFLSNKK
jgi:hypothetical protein